MTLSRQDLAALERGDVLRFRGDEIEILEIGPVYTTPPTALSLGRAHRDVLARTIETQSVFGFTATADARGWGELVRKASHRRIAA